MSDFSTLTGLARTLAGTSRALTSIAGRTGPIAAVAGELQGIAGTVFKVSGAISSIKGLSKILSGSLSGSLGNIVGSITTLSKLPGTISSIAGRLSTLAGSLSGISGTVENAVTTGAPPVPTQPPSQSETLITKDAAVAPSQVAKAKWGIFLNGRRPIIPDNLVSIEYKRDWRIAEYPMEQGAFESYNKVTMPYDARVRMTKGGTEADRQRFLDDIEALSESLELCDVVTPEKVYTSANITHFDYHRTAHSGVGLITVDIFLIEVRVTVSTAFSNTAAPSGAAVVNAGTVQPQNPTPAQSAPIASAGASGDW